MAFRPERVYRIADARHPLFDGTGAFLVGARWNSPGKRIIYAADSFAAAMLEVLVHARIGRLPTSHKWIVVSIPADVSVEAADAAAMPGWDAEDSAVACATGDAWYDSRRSLILLVPSVVTNGQSWNVMVNQEHAEFSKLEVSEARDVRWDTRFLSQ
jgi:RES domain-containing protein